VSRSGSPRAMRRLGAVIMSGVVVAVTCGDRRLEPQVVAEQADAFRRYGGRVAGRAGRAQPVEAEEAEMPSSLGSARWQPSPDWRYGAHWAAEASAIRRHTRSDCRRCGETDRGGAGAAGGGGCRCRPSSASDGGW